MQTFVQTFTGPGTWELNVLGKFFTVLGSTNAVNVRLYKNGAQLALGEIKGLGAGLEVGGMAEGVEFDRVQIDATAADTITIGIGNGQSRYNRGASNVTMIQNRVAQMVPVNTAKTVTNVSGQLLAANASRQYLLIQNKDPSGILYVNFGAGAATVANGVQIAPGGSYELDCVVPTTAVQCIGSIASNANVLVVEG